MTNTTSKELDTIIARLRLKPNGFFSMNGVTLQGISDIAAKKAIEAYVAQRVLLGRITEVLNHPKKTDNRWRDDRISSLRAELTNDIGGLEDE